MTRPLLSLIVPAKDAAPYLATMFQSVLAQGLPWSGVRQSSGIDIAEFLRVPWQTQHRADPRTRFDLAELQLIFIDDGSTDATQQVLAQYGEQFPNFEVVRNETPVGLANGRNEGLARADGRYIAFLDGDDWLAPGQLRLVTDAIRALEVDFVRCDHVQVMPRSRQPKRVPMAVRNRSLDPRLGILPVHTSTSVDYPYAWAGVFDRGLLDAGLLDFPADFFTAEDREWIWRLHLRARSFAAVDVPGIMYRRGLSNSLSQTLTAVQLQFTEAFARVFALVAADRQAAQFWPKVARNWLGILHHQVTRFTEGDPHLFAQLIERSRATSALIPTDVLVETFRASRQNRRTALFPYLPHPQLLAPMMKVA